MASLESRLLLFLHDNSTDTDQDDDDDDEETNNHLRSFLYNFGMLLCFLGVLVSVYLIFLFLMSRCERTVTERWKAARAQFIKSQLVVREWIGYDTTASIHASTEHPEEKEEVAVDIETPPPTDNTVVCKAACRDATGTSSPCLDSAHDCLGHCSSTDDDDEDCDQQDHCEATCVICMSSFENHERVCESNNSECQHVFHEACMLSWLQKHNRCPVCRQPYLVATADRAGDLEEQRREPTSTFSA